MLKDNLAPAIAGIVDIREVLDALQPEVDRLDDKARQMREEFFVDGITVRTIAAWEDLMGFPGAADWPIARRRERIRARLLATAPVTPALLQETIERVGGIAVEIIEDPSVPQVTVKFTGGPGLPQYIEDIRREVETIRPYHVPVLYDYRFAVLGDYAGYTLGELADYTLEQLANGDPLREAL